MFFLLCFASAPTCSPRSRSPRTQTEPIVFPNLSLPRPPTAHLVSGSTPCNQLRSLGAWSCLRPSRQPRGGMWCCSPVPLLSSSTITALTQARRLSWSVAPAYWTVVLPFHPPWGSKCELLRNTNPIMTTASIQPPVACKHTQSVSSCAAGPVLCGVAPAFHPGLSLNPPHLLRGLQPLRLPFCLLDSLSYIRLAYFDLDQNLITQNLLPRVLIVWRIHLARYIL